MNNGMFNYIDQLLVIAFFSGYPLVYAIVKFIATEWRKGPRDFMNTLVLLLPYAYALSGTLFLGLVINDLSADFSIKNIAWQFQNPYLKIWGLFAVLFWIPLFNKKKIFSLLHSLVFFFLLAKSLFLHRGMISNDMKIYTLSLLINVGTLAAVAIIHSIIKMALPRKKNMAK